MHLLRWLAAPWRARRRLRRLHGTLLAVVVLPVGAGLGGGSSLPTLGAPTAGTVPASVQAPPDAVASLGCGPGDRVLQVLSHGSPPPGSGPPDARWASPPAALATFVAAQLPKLAPERFAVVGAADHLVQFAVVSGGGRRMSAVTAPVGTGYGVVHFAACLADVAAGGGPRMGAER